jgi:hypothetical protein
MGKEYPLGYDYFHRKCRAAFEKQRHLADPGQIQQGLNRCDYILKELEALYHVRKYRAMKQRYYDGSGSSEK